MPEIRRDPGYATFINTFRCRPQDQEEVVRINVDIVDQVASSSPGFISASVHRSTDGTRVFNSITGNRLWLVKANRMTGAVGRRSQP